LDIVFEVIILILSFGHIALSCGERGERQGRDGVTYTF
jgi:hypothetical protein